MLSPLRIATLTHDRLAVARNVGRYQQLPPRKRLAQPVGPLKLILQISKAHARFPDPRTRARSAELQVLADDHRPVAAHRPSERTAEVARGVLIECLHPLCRSPAERLHLKSLRKDAYRHRPVKVQVIHTLEVAVRHRQEQRWNPVADNHRRVPIILARHCRNLPRRTRENLAVTAHRVEVVIARRNLRRPRKYRSLTGLRPEREHVALVRVNPSDTAVHLRIVRKAEEQAAPDTLFVTQLRDQILIPVRGRPPPRVAEHHAPVRRDAHGRIKRLKLGRDNHRGSAWRPSHHKPRNRPVDEPRLVPKTYHKPPVIADAHAGVTT